LEIDIKRSLKGYGGVEIYSLSLVPKDYMTAKGLELKNPLGEDSKYLRTSLMPSLINAAKENAHEKGSFHLFEMANIYIPNKGALPEEKLMIAGIFKGYLYREAKGVIESMLRGLRIKSVESALDMKYFSPSKRVELKSGSTNLGQLGLLENEEYLYYEFDLETLKKSQEELKYIPIPKYPPQIEDITLVLPKKTKAAEVVQFIKSASKDISNAIFLNSYKDSGSFRIWYQSESKTLTNKEVDGLRSELIESLGKKFGTSVKN